LKENLTGAKIKQFYSTAEAKIKQWWAKLSLLDRYILSQILEIFILGVVIFTSIIFASETFTQLIKQISMFGIPFNIAIMMVVLNLPQVFVVTIPISTLFAVVMTINKLSLNSEITVLRACGVGINRIAKPVFAFAIVATFASLFINEFIVPSTSRMSQNLAIYSLQNKHVPEGKMNYTLKEMKEGNILRRLIYVQQCKNKTLNNVTVLDMANKDTMQLIQAKTGSTDDKGWVFENGIIYTLSRTGKVFNTTLFETSTVKFGLENISSLVKDNSNQYSFLKLKNYIKSHKSKLSKKDLRRLKVELWDKLALPLTTVSLALVGIPLALTPPRVRYNRGFLFSVLIIFVYYLIRAFSLNLGETGTMTSLLAACPKVPVFIIGIMGAIEPLLAAWLPMISIFIIGAILYYRKAYRIT